jgi:hypothetical protein
VPVAYLRLIREPLPIFMISRFAAQVSANARARRAGDAPALPLAILIGLAVMAVVYIVYVLWPRWGPEPAELGAPSLPITIAGVPFNVPPAAIRAPVQRRGGAQERVDLAFLWPSLGPAETSAKVSPAEAAAAASRIADRIFLTVAVAGDALAPAERVKTIYPRYASIQPVAGPDGLAVLAFRDGSPYQGEDLIYDAQIPENFLVRCTRDGATPGTCLYERRIERADLTARFPRDWLIDWRVVAANINRLIGELRAPSAPAPAR